MRPRDTSPVLKVMPKDQETGVPRDATVLVTAQGMSIRFDENDARVMGRSAAGVIGIDLAEGDEVVGGVVCDDSSDLLTVCETGYGKRTPMREYLVQSEDGTTRVQSRGGKGRIDIRTEDGKLVCVSRITMAILKLKKDA